MRRVQCLATGLVAIGFTACAAGAPEVAPPAPALHELAQLGSSGRLDAGRMACTLAEVVVVAEEYRERLPQFRQAHAALGRRVTSDHSRSVQQGMRSADVQAASEQLALTLTRSQHYYESEGELSKAAQMSDWVGYVREGAAERAEVPVGIVSGAPMLSDEEADLLVEYSGLLAQASAPVASATVRLREIESTSPTISELHASMALGLYRDPALLCGG